MANYQFIDLADEYQDKYDKMKIQRISVVKSTAQKIADGKDVYKRLETRTGIPWYFIGLIHLRESNCNFTKHLHNGDPLTGKTYRVPANRPIGGAAPYSFEYSAIDALKMKGYDKIKDWSIPRLAYCLEKYNGFGYRMRGCPSAYLWAGTNQYESGKFIFDGPRGWRPNVVDQQIGVMGVLKYIMDNFEDAKVTVPAQPKEDEEKLSPKAELPRPTNQEMNEVSRKHWYNDLMQKILGIFGLGGTTYKIADAMDLETTKNTVLTIKEIAIAIGAFGFVAICIGLVAYFWYQNKLIKDDVQEGRATPSGEAE